SVAVGKAQAGASEEQRAMLLELLAARRHAAALATVALPSPWEPAEVTVERIDDDQERPVLVAARPLPEVVPAGARMLPIVARPLRYRWDTVRGRLADIQPVGHGDPWTNKKPDRTTAVQPSQVTTPVP